MADLVTKDSLKDMLDEEKYGRDYIENVIGRALYAIFQRQTEAEKSGNVTNTDNGVGFTGADAHGASITAKYWCKNRRHDCPLGGLSKAHKWRADKWLEEKSNGYPRLCKYSKQLNEIANAKVLT